MPMPPDDQELRNVIDKLAQFVARNGPEFEKMTMEKQKDNPKFSFLFGGEFYSYYKCKLALEQQQREFPSGPQPPRGSMRAPPQPISLELQVSSAEQSSRSSVLPGALYQDRLLDLCVIRRDYHIFSIQAFGSGVVPGWSLQRQLRICRKVGTVQTVQPFCRLRP
uniref:SURP motif domain-containing protein n=1 Tax=Mus musculus TaxID=10090 RepID=Q9CYM4_MOUSE|nr:unnamed protein product [Mus musculus]